MQVWFSLGSHSKNASSSSWKHWLCWVPWWLRGWSVCSMYRGCVLTAARVQIQTVASCSTSPPLAHPCFLSHTHTHMHKRKIHLPHPLISWPAAFIGAPDCCVPPHSLWLDSSGADWESAYINANTEKYTSGWSDHWRQCYFLLVLEKREEGGGKITGQERRWRRADSQWHYQEQRHFAPALFNNLFHTLTTILDMEPSSKEQRGCQTMTSQLLVSDHMYHRFKIKFRWSVVSKLDVIGHKIPHRGNVAPNVPKYNTGRCASDHLNEQFKYAFNTLWNITLWIPVTSFSTSSNTALY